MAGGSELSTVLYDRHRTRKPVLEGAFGRAAFTFAPQRIASANPRETINTSAAKISTARRPLDRDGEASGGMGNDPLG